MYTILKIFQLRVVDLSETYVSYYISVICG
jgi:hypothetical protein